MAKKAWEPPPIKDREGLIQWLSKRGHREDCPECSKEPKRWPCSLIKSSFYCPQCQRIWRYRYLNPQNSINKALRYWMYVEGGDYKPRRIR